MSFVVFLALAYMLEQKGVKHGISNQGTTHQTKEDRRPVLHQFPTAIAEAMEFEKGETVEWIIQDKGNLILHRTSVPPSPVTVKKTKRRS